MREYNRLTLLGSKARDKEQREMLGDLRGDLHK